MKVIRFKPMPRCMCGHTLYMHRRGALCRAKEPNKYGVCHCNKWRPGIRSLKTAPPRFMQTEAQAAVDSKMGED